jgi:hypothetical protein
MSLTFANARTGHTAQHRGLRRSIAPPLCGGLAAAVAVLSFSAAPAHAGVAGLVFVAPSFQAAQGSSGSFDLLLDDAAVASLHLAGESVRLGVGGSGVQFTDTTAATTVEPYLFPDSFDVDNGFTLDASGVPYPKTDVTTSDLSNIPASFIVMNPGASLGVVHVSYTIDPDATLGRHALTFEDLGGGTSTSDENGVAVPFSVGNGTLTITAAVPEPATLDGVGAVAIVLCSRSRRGHQRRRRA